MGLLKSSPQELCANNTIVRDWSGMKLWVRARTPSHCHCLEKHTACLDSIARVRKSAAVMARQAFISSSSIQFPKLTISCNKIVGDIDSCKKLERQDSAIAVKLLQQTYSSHRSVNQASSTCQMQVPMCHAVACTSRGHAQAIPLAEAMAPLAKGFKLASQSNPQQHTKAHGHGCLASRSTQLLKVQKTSWPTSLPIFPWACSSLRCLQEGI